MGAIRRRCTSSRHAAPRACLRSHLHRVGRHQVPHAPELPHLVRLPRDTLMYFVIDGIGGATRMLCFLKWSMAASAGPPVFSMTKFVCESMTRSMRALAWL